MIDIMYYYWEDSIKAHSSEEHSRVHVPNKMRAAIHYCELFMCSQGFIILAHIAQLFRLQIYGGKVLFF